MTLYGLLEAVGEGTILAAHVSPTFRPAFPSSPIISERSSPSRVRFAAPNNGAPLTAPGRSDNTFWTRGKGSCRTAYRVGGHFAAKMVPFFAATDNGRICGDHRGNIYFMRRPESSNQRMPRTLYRASSVGVGSMTPRFLPVSAKLPSKRLALQRAGLARIPQFAGSPEAIARLFEQTPT